MKLLFVHGQHRCLIRMITIFLLFLSGNAIARSNDGLIVDAALGRPSVSITNPTGSKAVYDGISVVGSLMIPLFGDRDFSTNLYGAIRYHDLENTYKSDAVEFANHIGPALGFQFVYSKLYLKLDYAAMKARHYMIGVVSNRYEYSYQATNATVGIDGMFRDIRIGLAYTLGMGTIKASDTGLTKDSDVAEHTIWLNVTYQLKSSLSDISRELVK